MQESLFAHMENRQRPIKRAKELGITLIDATCPVVAKVQERIRKFYDEGYQVVIFGKKEHAEVIGLVGHTNGEAHCHQSLWMNWKE